MTTHITIDGWGPVPIVRPTSIAAVSATLREAAANHQVIYPVGGGTMLDVGLPPTKQGIGLDTRGLNAIVDYPARDMTITVQAGISIAALQATLAAENQHLPVDIPHPEQATLGGALATNASGPRRFGYGTLRDYVIGLSVVNDRGEEVKAGGRVVKNVAGYDMMKLYTGSYGTLGLITQVTLKVPPRPETCAVVLVACPADRLAYALHEILPTTKTRPVGVSVLNRAGAPADFKTAPYVLAIAYEDQTTTVDWQIAQLRSELPTNWDVAIHHHAAAHAILAHLRDLPLSGQLTFKANLLPANTAAFLEQISHSLPTARLVAHAGNGIVYGNCEHVAALEPIQAALAQWSQSSTVASGNLTVPRCPTAWKTVLPVWGQPSGDIAVMRAIKAKLDPGGLFNPGRFVGGL